ncbi:MAG: hypothetical protein ACPGAQ_06585, partial [Candidatus Puniceispirillaceae bacterium]
MKDKRCRDYYACLKPTTRAKITVELDVKTKQYDWREQNFGSNAKYRIVFHFAAPFLALPRAFVGAAADWGA